MSSAWLTVDNGERRRILIRDSGDLASRGACVIARQGSARGAERVLPARETRAPTFASGASRKFGWQSLSRFVQKAVAAGIAGLGAAIGGGAAPASAASQARPAEQAVITLKLQSTFPTTDIFHETLLDWGRKVEAMAGGRLKLDILPSGAVVGAFQLIDAVNDGILDGGLGVPAYWFGKNKGVSLFGTGPSFGMDAEMLLGWYHYGGGAALY